MMNRLKVLVSSAVVISVSIFGASLAYGQITPSADAYTNSAAPATNYGANVLLDVDGATQAAYIQFNLASIPATYTSADIAKATLKLYVNTVATAGSFNVDYINGTWAENTITHSLSPALGTTIAGGVPITTTDKNQFILIDVTPAVQAWLSGTANDGIALVANGTFNATFDSKENAATSHAPELDIVYAGTLSGVTTATGSGLTGGGTSGTLNLGLLTTCASGQVLEWSGTAWVCATQKGSGTVTKVASGTGLTGGPITGTGTLSIDTTKVPLLASANVFTGNQSVAGSMVSGTSASSTGGVLGEANAASGQTYGVGGYALSASGYGVEGLSLAGTGGIGVYGSGPTGVVGVSTGAGSGGSFTGWTAPTGSAQNGMEGVSITAGNSDPNNATNGGDGLVVAGGNSGHTSTASGTAGAAISGVGGLGHMLLIDGLELEGGLAPGGSFTGGNNNGELCECGGDGIDARPGLNLGTSEYDGYAGNFTGDVEISGNLNGSIPALKIDDPLDPENKYLLHAPVQSSEMKNMYDGTVTTDSQGHATVQLPEWFQLLNSDFRYQLTVIGQFAQAIVTREIENNQFEISTSAPGVKVSWQVTGVRQDAYAKAHPLVVEQEKQAQTRGFYIRPELYGAPPEKQIEWARHPQMMKRIKEIQAQQLAAAQKQVPGVAPQRLAVQSPAPAAK